MILLAARFLRCTLYMARRESMFFRCLYCSLFFRSSQEPPRPVWPMTQLFFAVIFLPRKRPLFRHMSISHHRQIRIDGRSKEDEGLYVQDGARGMKQEQGIGKSRKIGLNFIWKKVDTKMQVFVFRLTENPLRGLTKY